MPVSNERRRELRKTRRNTTTVLDVEQDAVLLGWLDEQPNKTAVIRDALYLAMDAAVSRGWDAAALAEAVAPVKKARPSYGN